jgi:hypothetical protein
MNNDDRGPVIDPPLYAMPHDKGRGPERERIQRLLKFERVADQYYDQVAVRILERFLPTTVGAMAGVNRMDANMDQFFVGFAKVGEDGKIFTPDDRTMGRGAGFCNYIAAGRDLGLPLNNLLKFPKFASNPVVDAGITAYNGQPLLTPEGLTYLDGTPVPANFVFGTLFIVSPEEEEWTKDDVAWLKLQATQVRDDIVAMHRQGL